MMEYGTPLTINKWYGCMGWRDINISLVYCPLIYSFTLCVFNDVIQTRLESCPAARETKDEDVVIVGTTTGLHETKHNDVVIVGTTNGLRETKDEDVIIVGTTTASTTTASITAVTSLGDNV